MLTTKQKRFCEEYLVDFNATRAAIRAGYSRDTARFIACENLTKPNILQFIDEKLSEMSIGGQEALKLISDIAKTSLNDYFTIKMVEHTPRVQKSLQVLIKEIENQIEFEKQFAGQAKLSKEERKAYQQSQKQRALQIIRYRLELKYNPKATRIVDGQTILVDSAELDMVKLVADKEGGRIKSISHTPHGPRVEMYSADVALMNIARIHGLYRDEEEKKNPVSIFINGKGVTVKKD